MIKKCAEYLAWLIAIVGFGIVVYKVNFILGVIYTNIMGTLWILLIFTKEQEGIQK